MAQQVVARKQARDLFAFAVTRRHEHHQAVNAAVSNVLQAVGEHLGVFVPPEAATRHTVHVFPKRDRASQQCLKLGQLIVCELGQQIQL